MYFILLALVLAVPCSGYVNCRTACLECHRNNHPQEVMDIYCSMCQECRERRMERIDRMKKKILRGKKLMDIPAGCPKPPQCSGKQVANPHSNRLPPNRLPGTHLPYYPRGCPSPPPCARSGSSTTITPSSPPPPTHQPPTPPTPPTHQPPTPPTPPTHLPQTPAHLAPNGHELTHDAHAVTHCPPGCQLACPPGCKPACPAVTGCRARISARSHTIPIPGQFQRRNVLRSNVHSKNLDSFYVGVPYKALRLNNL